METITAWKLFRIKKNGKITSLFANRKQELYVNDWMKAFSYPTSGLAHRPGWHCLDRPYAPHLKSDPKNENRIWLEVEIARFSTIIRPESQGGRWHLAKVMKILPQHCTYFDKTKEIAVTIS